MDAYAGCNSHSTRSTKVLALEGCMALPLPTDCAAILSMYYVGKLIFNKELAVADAVPSVSWKRLKVEPALPTLSCLDKDV
jgi:hypothetical protein